MAEMPGFRIKNLTPGGNSESTPSADQSQPAYINSPFYRNKWHISDPSQWQRWLDAGGGKATKIGGPLGFDGFIGDYGGGDDKAFDWSQFFGGGGGGFNFHVPSISAGHVTPGHATASHATASLIDTNDPIYSLFAPKPWMSGMLAKGREYTSAATEDNMRLMRDQATRAGVSTSSPAFMYMQSLQRRDQQKALANALRDAQLAWTLPAADRRHGALGQNAQMLTGTSQFNADADTRVSIANAGYSTQASMANASNQLSASQANAANSLSAQFQQAQLGQQGWMFQTNFIKDLFMQQQQLAQYISSAGGGGYGGYQGPSWGDYGNAALGGATGGLRLWDFIRGLSNPNLRDTRGPITGASEMP